MMSSCYLKENENRIRGRKRARLANAARMLRVAILGGVLTACATGPVVNKGNNIVIRNDVEAKEDVNADFDKAVALLEKNEYERGIRLLNRVVERSENSVIPYINLGIAYRKTGDMKRAEESLNKALELSPHHPAASNELAMVYRKTGNFSRARRTYERILERFPNFYPARKNLGILCDLYINDLKCAKANYEIYKQANPGDKMVAMWIVDLNSRIGTQQ